MFKFLKSIKQLHAWAYAIDVKTTELKRALDEAKTDLDQTKKDLTDALDLIGKFMDQTVLVAKDVNNLVANKPKRTPKKNG